MKKILIAGAGGAPSEGVIKSLIMGNKKEEIIGMGSEISDLILSSAKELYLVPYANDILYKEKLLQLLNNIKPDLIHFQNDLEIFYASMFKNEIEETGTKTFMPEHEVIDTCVHKYKSYLKFKEANIIVPENILINDENDLKESFSKLSDINGNIWLRSKSIGGGGKGSLPTNDFDLAKAWINRYNGWGDFIAAEMLTPKTVTWLSIWYEGELIVAQTRLRDGWIHSNRSISGITGVTKVGKTYSSSLVDEISINSIKSITNKPHGIFGVDLTYDKNDIPNPTEINISRFFTTVLFFTQAGLNLPEIFKDLALYSEFPNLKRKINPLKDDLMWFRGMDVNPLLVTEKEVLNKINIV